jgi:hypothetical protein
MKTTVRMRQNVEADLFLHPISSEKKLPNNCNKVEAKKLGAKHVSNESHKEILDEIARRAALDHVETHENEFNSDYDSCASISDDSTTDSSEERSIDIV